MDEENIEDQQELGLDTDQAEDVVAPTDDEVAKDDALANEYGPFKAMIDSNFMQYASYVICERAIPNVADGFKPVQRRIMHALFEKDDGRFSKVANIVGHTMQYHPHGDASIGAALVNMVNKGYLIEGQGNFGNIYTGDSAAAPRYIECRLTELAREQVFNKNLTKYIPSYDGRNQEPVTLPSKLPLLLMLGADGIAVGLATKILPHNFIELLEAQIAVLRKNKFKVVPDFLQGGIMDASEYADGAGPVKIRAKIEKESDKKFIIRALPYGVTTESLINSIEDAARKKKVAVKSIDDFTAENVEIHVTMKDGTKPERAIQALYAFSQCEVTIRSNIVVIQNKRPVQMTVSEIIRENAKAFVKILKGELTHRKNELLQEFHARTLTRIFIEERIYKEIETCKTQDAVIKAVSDGLAPFRNELKRDVTKADIDMLLALRIRRISLFDIEKNRKDIENILAELEKIEKNLKGLTAYAIRSLQGLLKKYSDQYPRRTELSTFKQVEVAKLTANELQINHDVETGYIGYQVKGEPLLECSSLDKLIVLWSDGTYRVVVPPDKMFVDKTMIYCAKADRKRVMTVLFTEEHFTFLKRFTTGGTILNKKYSCALPDSKVIYFQEGTPAKIYVEYKPAKKQRINQQVFDPSTIPIKGAKARGNHLTAKAIKRMSIKKPKWWNEDSGDSKIMD